jgi:glycosyltransferase involved in cell wall biosynthesis
MPLLTVIVPNYNHAAFLEQRMQSLLQQTWQDFDIILINDCSTDHSRSHVPEYANSKTIAGWWHSKICPSSAILYQRHHFPGRLG